MCNSDRFWLQFARISLSIFNVLFVLCGLVLMALGIWLLVDPAVLKLLSLTSGAFNSGLLRASAIIILTTGCIVFLISFLGLIGALMEHKWILGVYIAFLIVVFCIEIAGAVVAIAFKDWILDNLEETLYYSLIQTDPRYYVADNGTCVPSSNGALWDYVQIKMNCCGVHESPHTGYELLTYSLTENCPGADWLTLIGNRPLTCCANNQPNMNPSQAYTNSTMFNCSIVKNQGCIDSVSWWVGHYSPVLIGIGFGVAFFQIIGFIFAVCVCVNAPNGHCSGYNKY